MTAGVIFLVIALLTIYLGPIWGAVLIAGLVLLSFIGGNDDSAY